MMDIFEVISELCLMPEVNFLLKILGGIPVPMFKQYNMPKTQRVA